MGESRNAYRVLVWRPEGKRPLGRPRRRWEDNIKMDLREVGYDDRDWINLAQDRDRWRAYVRAAMNLRESEPQRGGGAHAGALRASGRRLHTRVPATGEALPGPGGARSRRRAPVTTRGAFTAQQSRPSGRAGRLVASARSLLGGTLLLPESVKSNSNTHRIPSRNCKSSPSKGTVSKNSPINIQSLMLAGSEFQSLGRAIVKENEYEELRWDCFMARICVHIMVGRKVSEARRQVRRNRRVQNLEEKEK
ncbi:hypothetical protein ANN_10744 [Periplaneta americana]|uniref:Uncharacterized protein n=1 Tax=Periplaneta americana TaxID=6978 RepID=A0ABQ8T4S3_PERAM|nr:hypothetical protein ANN_10744 [Periplaneta americana]